MTRAEIKAVTAESARSAADSRTPISEKHRNRAAELKNKRHPRGSGLSERGSSYSIGASGREGD